MNGLYLMLAQVDPARDLLPRPSKGGGIADTTDSLIILGFILILAAALFSWAYFLRKRPSVVQGSNALVRPKRRHHHSRDSRRHAQREEGESTRRIRVRRRRRRQSDDLRRNPTLEETGGLPPLRPEEPEGPSTAQSPS